MKIVIHISLDTLMAANEILKEIYNLPVSLDKRENVYKSIGFDLADKFDGKCKTQIKKANLFENKKIKISLMYHEAWALEEIIQDLSDIVKNDYRKALLLNLTNIINQKIV